MKEFLTLWQLRPCHLLLSDYVMLGIDCKTLELLVLDPFAVSGIVWYTANLYQTILISSRRTSSSHRVKEGRLRMCRMLILLPWLTKYSPLTFFFLWSLLDFYYWYQATFEDSNTQITWVRFSVTWIIWKGILFQIIPLLQRNQLD